MAQKDTLQERSLTQRILYKGIFDLQAVYQVVHDWLASRGYMVHESKFKTINKPVGRERQLNWQAYRKVTEFVAFWVYVEWMFNDAVDFEVVENGKKKTLTKAQLVISVQHAVELDFARRFTKTELHRHLLSFMHNWMYRKKIDTLWEDKLRFKMYELVAHIKETLNMMTKGNEHYDVW
jgi:hypothetical protein